MYVILHTRCKWTIGIAMQGLVPNQQTSTWSKINEFVFGL